MTVTKEDLLKDFRYIDDKVIETGKYITDPDSTEQQRAEYALYVVLEHILLCLIKQKEQSEVKLVDSGSGIDISQLIDRIKYGQMAKEMLE